jgi:hypothetical protein
VLAKREIHSWIRFSFQPNDGVEAWRTFLQIWSDHAISRKAQPRIDTRFRSGHWHSGVAILRPNAFQSLFGDQGVQFESVPADVADVRDRLSLKIALSTTAEASLGAVGGRTQYIARRLRSLSGRIDQINLTFSSLSRSLRKHKKDPRVLLNAAEEFEFGEEHVETFLDAIDSRYLEDNFTEEERRADRFSRRPI